MRSFKFSKFGTVKVLLAALLLLSFAGFAGSRLAPNVPLSMVLFYSVVGASALLIVLVIATVASLTFLQFILRKGGTDAQWFWFPSEPRGLVQLRAQTSGESAEIHKP